MITLKHGDCLEIMPTLAGDLVDSIVTDPPAGISFMGKEWDHNKGGRDEWIKWMSEVMIEAKRTLKPGGHALVWALPRTSHWTGMALENAGFEVRDCVYHIFGSGFPKSRDIGKDIEKISVGGIKNLKVVGTKKGIKTENGSQGYSYSKEYVAGKCMGGKQVGGDIPVYEINNEWEGWGTALKPAVECWWLVRKPISEKTVAQNVLKWGVGGINIDECRIEYASEYDAKHQADIARGQDNATNGTFFGGKGKSVASTHTPTGRFPANVIHDGSDEVSELFPKSKSTIDKTSHNGNEATSWFVGKQINKTPRPDSGSAARFFYSAKPSQSERNDGVEGEQGDYMDKGRKVGSAGGTNPRNRGAQNKRANHHPTVKAQALMNYLVKLITPKGGTVLDPFMGSGSTGVACRNLGMNFIGIEKEQEYLDIARKRIFSDMFAVSSGNIERFAL